MPSRNGCGRAQGSTAAAWRRRRAPFWKKQPTAKLAAVRRKKEKGFGTLMHERFREIGLTDEEYAQFQKGIDELNGNWSTQTPKLDKERTTAASVPGFGTRASARFKGIGLTRQELEAFNRAVDKRRKKRPRLAKIDR